MTYEEKLNLILEAINEATKSARKGYCAKLYYSKDNGLENIKLSEIDDILLQLQDDEKIIIVKDTPTELKSKLQQPTEILEGEKDYFLIDILEEFTNWYEKRILTDISRMGSVDWINLLKIFDVVIDIKQELQITGKNIVYIDSLPQLVKFPHLFPQDDIGTRRKYQEYRMQGVGFLNKRGIVREYRYIDTQDGGYGKIKMVVDIIKFKDFSQKIDNEHKRRFKKQVKSEKTKEPKTTIKTGRKKVSVKASYDPKKGELDIEGKKVKFKKDSFRAKLLELLLKDEKSRRKEWSWDEVIEAIEDTKDKDITKEKKKKFYPACDGLSKHIALKIGVNDLLIFNKTTVQITPKYI